LQNHDRVQQLDLPLKKCKIAAIDAFSPLAPSFSARARIATSAR
jgi:hypothetical protein